MIKISHLLDDFAMGGVTQALKLFETPRVRANAISEIVRIAPGATFARRYDADLIVVHVPPRWGRLPYLASLRMMNPRARIIQVEHSYTRSFEAANVQSRRRFRTLLRIAANMVDRVVAVSNGQKAWLSEIGIPDAKLRTIHPYCDRVSLFNTPAPEQRRGPLRLLTYGRLSAEKNYASLLEAMLGFGPQEVELVIFGAGPEQERLARMAEDIDNVHLLPACNDPSQWLEWCDAVVMPSHRESFGLVATEARMAGRPILVADVDGLPEQAANGSGFVMPLRDADDIELAIEELLDADLISMGRVARAGVIGQNKAIEAAWREEIQLASRGAIRDTQMPLGMPARSLK